jgi:hypothetical protein
MSESCELLEREAEFAVLTIFPPEPLGQPIQTDWVNC